MHSSGFLSLLLVALISTAALAAPTHHQPKKRSFKIARTRQRDYVPNGTNAMRKAYYKFGLPGLEFLPKVDSTSTDSSGLAAGNGSPNGTENGRTSASPVLGESEFLSPVTVGGQTLVMDFDTGSSDMWVFNTLLGKSSQTNHTIFDPSKSSTFKEMPDSTFTISYGDQSRLQGLVGTDTVDIGGATVTQQAIGLPTILSASFIENSALDGLVGLAFSKLNTIQPQPQKTFFDNIMSDLAQPVFTANLKHGEVGGYEFGNIDSTQFQGSLTKVPVDNSNGFWQFNTATFVVGSGPIQTSKSTTAIADTGTSLMLVDNSMVQAYYSQVSGAQNSQARAGMVFPCDSVLPDLKVAVGDSYVATVSGQLMNFSNAYTDRRTGTPFCFGGLQSNGVVGGFQIFGDVFFKSQFVAFDGVGPSLGLAPHA